MSSRIQKITAMFAVVVALAALTAGAPVAAQTPAATGCDTVGTPADAGSHAHHGAMPSPTMATDTHGMEHGTPMAGMHAAEFDLMYIDMMIPHHESVIALAEVAVDELSHPELIGIAEAIIETQDAEIAELESLRAEWYPDAAPVSMDEMMTMPGMGGFDMATMDQVMNAEWQVQAFCAADDKDLAFIEQVIPHHEMALAVSEAALEQSVHPELVPIAEEVIAAQEAEIAALEAIRAELTGEATPES